MRPSVSLLSLPTLLVITNLPFKNMSSFNHELGLSLGNFKNVFRPKRTGLLCTLFKRGLSTIFSVSGVTVPTLKSRRGLIVAWGVSTKD